MNYATQNNIGNGNRSRTEKTTAIAQTVGRICTMDAKTKGRRRGEERQAEIRTDCHATNGILKCTFLPKLKIAQSVQACQKTERDFYKSLSYLSEHYSIEPMHTQQDYDFPYNIALAMWDMETKVKSFNRNWNGFKLLQDSTKTFFVSEEKYDTATTLYYVPVIPLFQMLKDPKRKKTAQLLLSVCGYLYHIAQIPYYRQEESYLYWQYEMFDEWLEYGDQSDESEFNKRELRQADYVGDKIEQKLYNFINLEVFEKRLNRFKCRDTFDMECWQVAFNAFTIYKEYPNANVFQNAPISEQNPYDEDCADEILGMEKYISFIADTEGWLFERIVECINSEFNEYGQMEAPSITKVFDGSKETVGNLDFENRLFALISDLGGLLYEYKTAKK